MFAVLLTSALAGLASGSLAVSSSATAGSQRGSYSAGVAISRLAELGPVGGLGLELGASYRLLPDLELLGSVAFGNANQSFQGSCGSLSCLGASGLYVSLEPRVFLYQQRAIAVTLDTRLALGNYLSASAHPNLSAWVDLNFARVGGHLGAVAITQALPSGPLSGGRVYGMGPSVGATITAGFYLGQFVALPYFDLEYQSMVARSEENAPSWPGVLLYSFGVTIGSVVTPPEPTPEAPAKPRR